MTIEDLKKLLGSGEFHHATYRCHGTLWEGLWIYKKDTTGHRGFRSCGTFPRNSPDLKNAEDLVRHTGVSVGSYGKG